MSTNNGLIRTLAAALLLASMMPAPVTATPPPPVCEDTDNENGWGGTHVYCDFTCGANTLIEISVAAQDNEATTAVWTDCADVSVDCDLGTQVCVKTATELTSYKDWDNCHGRSYE